MTSIPLPRRALAEFLGTSLLMTAVVGAGIAAQRLSPNDVGLQLLENAVVVGAALVALILAFGAVSSGLNPVVTLVERALGAITTAETAALVGAQVAGSAAGAVLANLMFDLPAITVSTHVRSSSGLWLGEFVATFGLIVVIFGVVRAGRREHVAYAVASYITAAAWFTSSTSFANPAISIGRTLTNSSAGIAPESVPMFVLMQVFGGAVAVAAVLVLYPNAAQIADDIAHLDFPMDASETSP